MSRKIEEIQEDIRTLTRVPSMFINAKLDELAEEVGQIRADAIDEYFEIIKKYEDMLGCVMICQCESIAEQLKEQNK